MTAPESKYLEFLEVHDTGKTKVFKVVNKQHGSDLGKICWFASWRRYVFMTSVNNLVFDAGCMENIKDYIDYLMKSRTNGK